MCRDLEVSPKLFSVAKKACKEHAMFTADLGQAIGGLLKPC